MATYNGINIPESVAVIMDGNGRWAVRRGLPRTAGHKEGCKAVEAIIPAAAEIGIRYFTVYAFSTENWNRSKEEVEALMQLFRFYSKKLLGMAVQNNVRIRFIGDVTRFPQDIVDSVCELEKNTGSCTGMTFVIAANYGGRDEIKRAVTRLAEDVRKGNIGPSDVSESRIKEYLDTADIPDPDLIIRTSGEMRISNFLLWECAYSEFVATDVLWPDFDKDELLRCIESFGKRSRRFGGV